MIIAHVLADLWLQSLRFKFYFVARVWFSEVCNGSDRFAMDVCGNEWQAMARQALFCGSALALNGPEWDAWTRHGA